MVARKAMLQPPSESVEGEKDVGLFEELVVKRVERKGTGNEGRDLGGEVTGISMVQSLSSILRRVGNCKHLIWVGTLGSGCHLQR